MSKKRRVSIAEESSAHKKSIQEHGEPSNKPYGDISVDGHAMLWLGDYHEVKVYNNNYNPDLHSDRCQKLLESLNFERMDARLWNVAAALPNTCQWLMNHEQFRLWTGESQVSEQHSFLWIKGKPGSGKSTIMKEAVTWAERVWPQNIILTYFFNARTHYSLEKSSLGLYRSFLYKLLKVHHDGYARFTTRFASKQQHDGGVEEWTVAELQNFLIELVETGKLPALTLFIDALDEGDHDDVRHMIIFFDQLTSHAARAGAVVRVCLSSRHYPRISLRRAASITVEGQIGHGQDIEAYVCHNLAGELDEMEELRHRVCSNSGGIFLWVVVVVKILNELYDQGETVSTMMSKLDTVPQDLHKLFGDILSRNPKDVSECMALLRWILFSLRPLRPAELYVAVKTSSTQVVISKLPSQDTVARYLLNCSRGLVERVATAPPSVQFIHETVRDFLRQKTVPGESDLTDGNHPIMLEDFSADSCHAKVAEECLQFLINSSQTMTITDNSTKPHPLAEYAAEFWWQHVRLSGQVHRRRLSALAQELLVGETSLLTWVRLFNVDRPPQGFQATLTTDDLALPLYYAASIGFAELVSTLLEQKEEVNAQGGRFDNALQVACLKGHEKVVQQLLENGANVRRCGGEYHTALQAASKSGHLGIVHQLLSKGADINAQGGYYGTALQAASFIGDEEIVQILLDQKADIDAQGGCYGSALEAASAGGRKRIVQTLLQQGAAINAQSGVLFGNALCAASAMGHESVVQVLLLDDRTDVNAEGRYYGSALQAASRKGYRDVVQLLLSKGADVHAQGGNYGTALHSASNNRHWEIVKILIDAGAEG